MPSKTPDETPGKRHRRADCLFASEADALKERLLAVEAQSVWPAGLLRILLD